MAKKKQDTTDKPPSATHLNNEFHDTATDFAMVSVLHRARELRAVLRTCREILEQLLGCADFVIYVRDGHGAMSEALVHGQPKKVADHESITDVMQPQYGGEFLAIVPLVVEGRRIGLAVVARLLGDKQEVDALMQRHFDIFAEHAAIALDAALHAPAALRDEAPPPSGGYVGALVVNVSIPLAIPIQQVLEVSQMVALAGSAPGSNPGCVGLINYRGELIPLFDLNACLASRRARDIVQLTRGYVVVLQDGQRYSCVVDTLMGLLTAEDSSEVPLPSTGHEEIANSAVMFQKQVVPLVNRLRWVVKNAHSLSS